MRNASRFVEGKNAKHVVTATKVVWNGILIYGTIMLALGVKNFMNAGYKGENTYWFILCLAWVFTEAGGAVLGYVLHLLQLLHIVEKKEKPSIESANITFRIKGSVEDLGD